MASLILPKWSTLLWYNTTKIIDTKKGKGRLVVALFCGQSCIKQGHRQQQYQKVVYHAMQ
jgi:hypothetical protein